MWELFGFGVFPRQPETVTLTVSLTHEIYSYSRSPDPGDDLALLASQIFAHTAPGGVWLNLDVAGPEVTDQKVILCLRDTPPPTDAPITFSEWAPDMAAEGSADVKETLVRMSPAVRFRCFVRDFRRQDPRPAFQRLPLTSVRLPSDVEGPLVPVLTTAGVSAEFLSLGPMWIRGIRRCAKPSHTCRSPAGRGCFPGWGSLWMPRRGRSATLG